jgi:hypothetical protein
MKSHIVERRALGRFYRIVRSKEDEDLASDDPNDRCDRAERLVRSLKPDNQLRLAWHVRDRHGLEALEDFSFLMEPMAGAAVMLEVVLMRA